MNTRTTRHLLALGTAALAASLLIACSKTPVPAPMAPAAPTTLGTQVDDTVVTSNVKTALLADPAIKSMDISVVTVKGEVQLSGMVDTQGQIDQATQVATGIVGASSVKNELRVKP
ncbi:MAG: BON domain-containing protein [Aquabacterium sp.]|nr:BON domain-containing protein [Aquabacterium sp.]